MESKLSTSPADLASSEKIKSLIL